MADKYEIVVVGAGPAGSSTAIAAARKGMKVLLVERKETIGHPVRCAEYIPKALLGELPVRKRAFLVQMIKGMKTFLPDGSIRETLSPGFTINRHVFDQCLANGAMEAGAKIMTGTRVIGQAADGVLLKNTNGMLKKVIAKVIVGADGPKSVVRKWMGIARKAMIPAVQVRVKLKRRMDFTEIYFRPEIYGGYGWVFPKGDVANVGIGMVKGPGGKSVLSKVLGWFVEYLFKLEKIRGEPYDLNTGWIPVEPTFSVVKKNFMLVGDAAGHTHPITGAGVAQAVICGTIAGRWAYECVSRGNLNLLKTYDREWRELFWDSLSLAHEKRKILEKKWHQLEHILPFCWVAFREYHKKSQPEVLLNQGNES